MTGENDERLAELIAIGEQAGPPADPEKQAIYSEAMALLRRAQMLLVNCRRKHEEQQP